MYSLQDIPGKKKLSFTVPFLFTSMTTKPSIPLFYQVTESEHVRVSLLFREIPKASFGESRLPRAKEDMALRQKPLGNLTKLREHQHPSMHQWSFQYTWESSAIFPPLLKTYNISFCQNEALSKNGITHRICAVQLVLLRHRVWLWVI